MIEIYLELFSIKNAFFPDISNDVFTKRYDHLKILLKSLNIFVRCLELSVNHHVLSYVGPISDLHAAQIHIAKQPLLSYQS